MDRSTSVGRIELMSEQLDLTPEVSLYAKENVFRLAVDKGWQ
jgi:hypothetical protein